MNDQTTVATSFVPDVMVSYSSHDRVQVMQFVQRLRAAGVAAWIDQGGIDGAQKWGEEIVNAIDACKTVVLMISQTSMQSENIAKEVMLAWENGKHFLPLCLEDAKIAKSMQYQLAGIQQIKLYEGDSEAKFVSVLRALVRLGVYVSPYYIALISADLGDREQAFEWLNRAIEQRSSGLSRLKTESRLNILRSDVRFADLAKRVESLPLQEEVIVPDVPAVLSRPNVITVAPAQPASIWKKLLWPDIYDGRTARQAAAQGVWLSAFLVFGTILNLIIAAISPQTAAIFGAAWSTPNAVIMILIMVAIGVGVQKMGRPAAILGLILCAFGAQANLGNLQRAGLTLDAYTVQYRQFQQYQQQYPQYGYQNQIVPQYELASSQYYYAWWALLVSLVCVMAFINATRGTWAYHRMVMARQAPDKQDAIDPDDWALVKGKTSDILQKSRSAVATKAASLTQSSSTAGRRQSQASETATTVPLARSVQSAVDAVTTNDTADVPPAVIVTAPVVVGETIRQGFAALIGVSGGLVYWPRVGVFWLANVVAVLTFLVSRALVSSLSVPLAYWFYGICAASVFTLATIAGFRLIPNAWGAAAAAAALLTTLGNLLFVNVLPTFNWTDIGYREQFQQFALVPFASCFILLMALVWIVPRMQPMVLGLWLGAMGAEILTSVVVNILHALGAGDPADPVLGGASVISAVLRSLAFAGGLWAGLEYLKKKAGSASA